MKLDSVRNLTTGVIVLLLLSSCSDSKMPLTDVQQPCAYQLRDTSTHEHCTYVLPESFSAGPIVWFSSDPAMPVETLLELHLSIPEDLTIVHSDVVGVSMYMGRIPLQWSPVTNQVWQADLLIGACTDPNMLWMLRIEFENPQGARQTTEIPFHSSW
ncbi:MAG: hypothetical protein LAT77_00015 [Aliidiomarina sp.]|uniref:hypothetical protein n=1 Tax=Aliidiomarina sp. TaxID=1872439 RepID=UPI0025B7C317|nr:hypothetical protein [Aliidiomarina sp.]MCH8500273.1 hypothetical protein [Aliidiomarina sp.]